MKKLISNLPKVLILALVGWGFSAHAAHAGIFSGINEIAGQVVYQVGGTLINLVLHVLGYLLIVVGMLLDISINLTMHIKALVNSIPAIYQVWTTIRDISGLFFIFFLLYAAFKIILGFDGKYGDLIKNIVIAGILINFSFFITSVLIDMSNMVSLAIYNAMLPGQEVQVDDSTSIASLVNTDKGHALSGAFVQGLSLPTVFSADDNTKAASLSASSGVMDAFLKIILIGTIGILTMIIAGVSFVIASVAFIVRLFVLIFLLAFSPLWFASWVIPDLQEHSKKFTKMLYSQLVFMPVYLLLMYAALSILATNHMFGTAVTATSQASSSLPLGSYIVILINAIFVIFMLNLPLFAGLSIGGLVTGKKWGADTLGKWVGKKAGSWAGRNTAGRLASIANNSGAMKDGKASRSTIVRGLSNLASKQLGVVENHGFGEKKGGFKDTVDAKKKDMVKTHEELGKASAAEKARYGNSEEGKKNLKEMLDARQKKYIESMTQPNVLRTLINSAQKGTDWAKAQPVIAENKAGKVVIAAAQTTVSAADKVATTVANSAPGAAVSGSFGSAEKAAIEEINKKKDQDAKKKAGEDAAEKRAELERIESNRQFIYNESRNKTHEQVEAKEKEIHTKEAEVATVELQLKEFAKVNAARAAMGVESKNPQEEAQLAQLKKDLEGLKTAKVALEKQMKDLNDNDRMAKKIFEETKRGLNQKIETAAGIKEDEWRKDVTKELKEAAKGEGGGGGAAPKPAAGGEAKK